MNAEVYLFILLILIFKKIAKGLYHYYVGHFYANSLIFDLDTHRHLQHLS